MFDARRSPRRVAGRGPITAPSRKNDPFCHPRFNSENPSRGTRAHLEAGRPGPLLVLAYNLELVGGLVHNDAGFALAWRYFYPGRRVAQQVAWLSPAGAVVAAVALSGAHRYLSTPRTSTSCDVAAPSTSGGVARGARRQFYSSHVRRSGD